MNVFWSMVCAGCRAATNWYWGGFDGLLASLVVFVVMAHVTDGMSAVVDRRPIGRCAYKNIGIKDVPDSNQDENKDTLKNVLNHGPANRPAVNYRTHTVCDMRHYYKYNQGSHKAVKPAPIPISSRPASCAYHTPKLTHVPASSLYITVARIYKVCKCAVGVLLLH